MKKEKIAAKNLAMLLAYQNAAEMIRGHCEVGFQFDNQLLNDEYQKAIEVAYKRISKLAIRYELAYQKTGIEINSDCNGMSLC